MYLKWNLVSTLAGYARISGLFKSRKLIGKTGEPWAGILVVVGNESVMKAQYCGWWALCVRRDD